MSRNRRTAMALISVAAIGCTIAGSAAAAAAGPDLTPTAIKTRVAAEANQCTANIEARVRNIGKVDAGAYAIRFAVDGQPTDVPVPNGTNAGATTTKAIELIVARGAHTISVIADPDNSVAETNETNNTLGPQSFVCR